MDEDRHILVVDDERDLRESVGEYLELKGYRVSVADSGAAARAVVEREPVDLVVLDIRMPGEDGLSVARYLRERFDVGIIFLTASGEVVDRIIGLEVGADDYLAKPFDLRELLARIKAVLRRSALARVARPGGPGGPGGPGRDQAADANVVRFGRRYLNLDAHKLFDDAGTEIPVTAMEFDLLKAFAERPGRVLSRDQILELAHKGGWQVFDRSVDIRIARLRRKIEDDPRKPQVIKTVRGTGYVFTAGSGGSG